MLRRPREATIPPGNDGALRAARYTPPFTRILHCRAKSGVNAFNRSSFFNFMRTEKHFLTLPDGRAIRARITAASYLANAPVKWSGVKLAGLPRAESFDPYTLRALLEHVTLRVGGTLRTEAEGEWPEEHQ